MDAREIFFSLGLQIFNILLFIMDNVNQWISLIPNEEAQFILSIIFYIFLVIFVLSIPKRILNAVFWGTVCFIFGVIYGFLGRPLPAFIVKNNPRERRKRRCQRTLAKMGEGQQPQQVINYNLNQGHQSGGNNLNG